MEKRETPPPLHNATVSTESTVLSPSSMASSSSSSSLRTPYFRSEHESSAAALDAPPPRLAFETKLNFQYRGDVFGQHGTYTDATLYMSRLPSSRKGSILRPKPGGAAYRMPGLKLAPMPQQPHHQQLQPQQHTQQQQQQQHQHDKPSKTNKTSRKRQYALAVEAMASNELLRGSLLSDNVIPSLLALVRTKDATTLASCIATLCYLSSDPLGRDAILKNSAPLAMLTSLASTIPSQSPLAGPQHALLHNYLAMLANLTIEDACESVFVKEKALESVMKHRRVSPLAEQIATRALLNLSSPVYSYPRVDDVIRAIVHDRSRDAALSNDHRETLSRALYNLSCTRGNQTKLVEGDALGMLRGMLATNRRELLLVDDDTHKTDHAIRLNALMALWRLAENPYCRRAITRPDCMRALVDQLHKCASAVSVAAGSSGDYESPLQCTLMVLVCLASDEIARQRLAKADALDALALLVTRLRDATTQHQSSARQSVAVLYRLISLLLSTPATVEGVSASFLTFLLSFQHAPSTSGDGEELPRSCSRYVLFSLACVLWWNDNDEDATTATTVRPTTTTSVTSSSNASSKPSIDDLLDDAALLEPLLVHVEAAGFACDSPEGYLQLVLLYNLSFRYNKVDVAQRIAPRLKELAVSSSNARVRSVICATLFCLSQEYATHVVLYVSGVLDVLPRLMQRCGCAPSQQQPLADHGTGGDDEDHDTQAMSLEIVCVVFDGRMLARSELVSLMTCVAPALVALCENTSSASLRSACAACFARFAATDECRTAMAQQQGVIRALAILANEEDTTTLRLCVHAYSHLSRDTHICAQLIHSGIIKSLTFLAAAPEEPVRRACAVTLCNLSTAEENIGALAKAGALKALLVISCVKSNDPETRRICMKAVMNLLRLAATIPLLCQEGLLWAFGLFTSGMEPKDFDILCDAFCALTFYGATRKGVAKPAILRAMLQVLEAPSASLVTKTKLLRALSNVLCDLPHAALLIHVGVLPHLMAIVGGGEEGEGLDDEQQQQSPGQGEAHMLVAQILVLIFQSCPDAESEFAEPAMLQTIARLLHTRHDDCGRCVAILLYQLSLHATTRAALVVDTTSASSSSTFSLLTAVPSLFHRVARDTQALLVRLLYNVSCDEQLSRQLDAAQIVACVSAMLPKKIAALAIDVAALCAGLLRNLSCDAVSHAALMDAQATALVRTLFDVDDDACKEDAAVCLCNLFMGRINSSALLARSVLPMVLWLCSSRASAESRTLGTTVVRKLALAPGNTHALVDGGVISHLALLLQEDGSSLFVKQNCIATFCCVARKPSVPAILASYGVIANVLELLLQLQQASATDSTTTTTATAPTRDPLLEAMCVDLLSSLAEFARAEDPLESKLASILYRVLETNDDSAATATAPSLASAWQTDRSFLTRAAGAPLAPPSRSLAHQRISVKPPTLRHTLYPIRFAGYAVDFSQLANHIELRTVEPLRPSLEILGEIANEATNETGTTTTSSSTATTATISMTATRRDFAHIAAPSCLAFAPQPMFAKVRTPFPATPSIPQQQ